jgi:hypothetical protein
MELVSLQKSLSVLFKMLVKGAFKPIISVDVNFKCDFSTFYYFRKYRAPFNFTTVYYS